MADKKIDLTDNEWISVLDQDADGLPFCCANISALRDSLFGIVRYGRSLSAFYRNDFLRHLTWVEGGHDLTPVILKIKEQILSDPETLKMYEAMQEHHEGEREV